MSSNNILSRLKNPTVIAAGIAVLLLIIGEMRAPGFASFSQIINMLTVASFLGIVAAGQNLVVLSGEGGIDLSVGKVVTLGAIIGGAIANGMDSGVLTAFAVVMIATFSVGLLNGIGVTLIGIPPLIMTLSMGIVVESISRFITGGLAVKGATPFMLMVVTGRFLGIPGIVYIWILFTILFILFQRNSQFGMSLYTMGSNSKAARLSGVNVKWIRILTYGLSSMLAGLAGFLYLGYLGSIYNISLGNKYNLSSVVAVVVGGVSLAGGKGGYLGVAVGCILLQFLESFLTVQSIPPWGREIVMGITLLVLLTAYARETKLRQ
ncbi:MULTISPECIES: ABC transporter permease [unclassified Oceanispirochaeta]|uniref:ABC transporter permease n=1 Tax=unclassified Oceanispirochaeta TaxID=2635722 RepID=UPI000E0944C6|nr:MULTISPECIES: ABC transporter permease [unclassified Oceanispirochaeta]MBF9017443.1 ABC transporter permease [Oceanispirochaeta sp. M2]NPD74015.1 ABC transporter permease [Oceanispirochaeta sp. M1]RDG30186.1 ABC transporter permease [Oceanispirochaeta sp. M1]